MFINKYVKLICGKYKKHTGLKLISQLVNCSNKCINYSKHVCCIQKQTGNK